MKVPWGVGEALDVQRYFEREVPAIWERVPLWFVDLIEDLATDGDLTTM